MTLISGSKRGQESSGGGVLALASRFFLVPSGFVILVLLSMACPTSPETDQTKGGEAAGCKRTPRFGAQEQKVRSDEDTALVQIESKRICQENS